MERASHPLKSAMRILPTVLSKSLVESLNTGTMSTEIATPMVAPISGPLIADIPSYFSVEDVAVGSSSQVSGGISKGEPTMVKKSTTQTSIPVPLKKSTNQSCQNSPTSIKTISFSPFISNIKSPSPISETSPILPRTSHNSNNNFPH